MENQAKSQPKERNPITHQAHKREVLWQITLPLILGVLLFLGLALAASLGAAGKVSTWANIGIVWLILISFLPGLIVLILLAALVYGVTMLVVHVPEYALQIHHFFEMIVWQVKHYTDKTVEPVYRIESARAGFKSIFHK